MDESFFAAGGFAGVTTREHVLVAAIYDIAEDKICSDYSDVGSDVGNNLPDASFEGAFAVDVWDAAIPGSEAKKDWTLSAIDPGVGVSSVLR